MSEFEEAAVKVLGVILIGLLVIIGLQIVMGCASAKLEIIDEPIPNYIDSVELSTYAIVDYNF